MAELQLDGTAESDVRLEKVETIESGLASASTAGPRDGPEKLIEEL